MPEGPRFGRGLIRALRSRLSGAHFGLLLHGLGAFERVLPHVQVDQWTRAEGNRTGVTPVDSTNRRLRLRLAVPFWDRQGRYQHVPIASELARKTSQGNPQSRTFSEEEQHLAKRLMERLAEDLGVSSTDAVRELQRSVDERAITRHLRDECDLAMDPRPLIGALHGLAEQTYENRSVAFGVLLTPSAGGEPAVDVPLFPDGYLRSKKYRALSDGYRTAYDLDAEGRVRGLADLTACEDVPRGQYYFPEWARALASATLEVNEAGRCRLGVALTRRGDIVVVRNGSLRFSFRGGRWQYWNHRHIMDLTKTAAESAQGVVGRLYRLALDLSFRHSGGLIVVLSDDDDLRNVVRPGDAIGDTERTDNADREFDTAVGRPFVTNVQIAVLIELASLDGALVVARDGRVLAYGAVLRPKRQGRISGSEGSRTKAAIGASYYGVSIKISSDGDMTFYQNGQDFLTI